MKKNSYNWSQKNFWNLEEEHKKKIFIDNNSPIRIIIKNIIIWIFYCLKIFINKK